MSNVPDVEGVKIEVLQEGRGSKEAANKDRISMHYRGTLEDGSQFDASYDRGQPLDFVLGNGQVIQGWDLGLVGTKIGEKRRLTIQPDKGYGKRGFPGAIPPNAVLIFETELVSINGRKDEL